MTYYTYPKGPCTQIVDTLVPKYPNRDYIKAKVSTIWAHGPRGLCKRRQGVQRDLSRTAQSYALNPEHLRNLGAVSSISITNKTETLKDMLLLLVYPGA